MYGNGFVGGIPSAGLIGPGVGLNGSRAPLSSPFIGGGVGLGPNLNVSRNGVFVANGGVAGPYGVSTGIGVGGMNNVGGMVNQGYQTTRTSTTFSGVPRILGNSNMGITYGSNGQRIVPGIGTRVGPSIY